MFIFVTPALTATVEISNTKIKRYYMANTTSQKNSKSKESLHLLFLECFFLAYVIATKESTVCLVVLVKFLF